MSKKADYIDSSSSSSDPNEEYVPINLCDVARGIGLPKHAFPEDEITYYGSPQFNKSSDTNHKNIVLPLSLCGVGNNTSQVVNDHRHHHISIKPAVNKKDCIKRLNLLKNEIDKLCGSLDTGIETNGLSSILHHNSELYLQSIHTLINDIELHHRSLKHLKEEKELLKRWILEIYETIISYSQSKNIDLGIGKHSIQRILKNPKESKIQPIQSKLSNFFQKQLQRDS